MNTTKSAKRNKRTYTVSDSTYKKAMKRAKREGVFLSTLIDVWLTAYVSDLCFQIKPEVKKVKS